VFFTYRFAGIADQSLILPVKIFGFAGRNLRLGLARFGWLAVMDSILIGLVVGLSVRSSGGLGHATLKRFDVSGLLLIVYSILLMILEITLIKRPVPRSELMGMEAEAETVEESEMVYDSKMALFTAIMVAALAFFLKRSVRVISARTFWIAISLAVGKMVALYIDMFESSRDEAIIMVSKKVQYESEVTTTPGSQVFVRAIICALLCVVMFCPRVLLKPVHMKSAPRRYSGRRSSMGHSLSAKTVRTIILYSCVLVPTAVILAIPYVLFPLASALSAGNGSGDDESFYYANRSPAISEVIGFACALWGLACLSMLNYYLPDGGGDMYKKVAALTFLMGIGLVFCAPAAGGKKRRTDSVYAAMSSVSSELANQSRSRSGGWGLLSASLATLLAVSGPLQLKERRDTGSGPDNKLFLRMLIFSIMFGCGVTWFILMQIMSSDTGFIFLTTAASMGLALLDGEGVERPMEGVS